MIGEPLAACQASGMDDEQLLRYSRQIMLSGFDIAGQERLLAAKVLVVGLGGLGCPAALYLAAAGVGELVLADSDRVEIDNLQRQIAHVEADIGEYKVDSAARRIKAVNGSTLLQKVRERLAGEALDRWVERVDLVVDATDNFASRLDINRACVALGRPLVSGAAIRSEGQLAVFDPRRGSPCYRCLYPEAEAQDDTSCAESGVLAPMVGVIGSWQAQEAVKLLAGFGEPLLGKMLVLDARTGETRQIQLRKRPDCPQCTPTGC